MILQALSLLQREVFSETAYINSLASDFFGLIRQMEDVEYQLTEKGT